MKALATTLLLLVTSVCVVQAQTVTLPTIRSNKTIEVAMLDHALQDIKNDSANLGIAKKAGFSYKDLSCDLAQLALAPYSVKEVAHATTDSAGASRTNTMKSALLAQTGRRHSATSETPRYLAELLSSAPSSCVLSAPPSEEFVRSTMEKYLDAEDSVGRHARLDTLTRIAIANVIQTELRTSHWLPVRSHDLAMAFWKQSSSSSLNVGAVTGSNDQGTTFTELSSRFLHAIRLSFNTVLSSAKDSTKASTGAAATSTAAASGAAPAKADTGASTSAIARFLNGGGLLNLAATLPLMHYGSSNGAGDIIGLFAPRFGGTIPVLGASSRDTTLMYDVGTEIFLKSADYIDGVGVFFQTRVGIAGGTPKFMTLIGDTDKRHSAYQTVSMGISLDDKYLITLSRTVSGPHALQTGWQIGTTLARSAAPASASP